MRRYLLSALLLGALWSGAALAQSPLNGGFEAVTSGTPDNWTFSTSEFSSKTTGATYQSIEGAKYVELAPTSVDVSMTSAGFAVEGGRSYAPTFHMRPYSGSAASYAIKYYDATYPTGGSLLSTQTTSGAYYASANVWYRISLPSTAAPAGARMAELVVTVTAGSTMEFDAVSFDSDEPWNTLGIGTLQNSWVNWGGAYANARYRKDRNGWVTVEGLIKNGTVGATLFTLPAGYRPATNGNIYQMVEDNNTFGVIEVQSGGAVVMQVGASNANLSLQIRFHAEQ